MQRLGLCCLFIEAPIKFRTTTARYVSGLRGKGKDPLAYLSEIVTDNLASLLSAVDYCADHGIGAFRINSALLPIYTHPDCGYRLTDLPEAEKHLKQFSAVKRRAQEANVRLTFHPDQFVVLSSPSEDVVEKSIADLEYHAMMAELLGADVINIHGGGGYGDKESALKRFAVNFARLSSAAQSRLTLENDDITYTPQELLPVCQQLGIPLCYDVHHHRCLPDELSIEQATQQSLETWNREPLFHVSSPKEGWSGPQPRQHHDFIDSSDVPAEWTAIDPLTVDVEAKAKEQAVSRLRGELLERGWRL